jgi:hypothetical protein
MVNMAGLHSARSSRLPNTFFELLSLLLAMTPGRARRLRMISPDQALPVRFSLLFRGETYSIGFLRTTSGKPTVHGATSPSAQGRHYLAGIR